MKRVKLLIFLLSIFISGSFINKANALVDTPWGPDRTTFTWADPAPYATFNSITDNPQLGDERNFVRIREVKEGELFGDEVTLERGKTYEVYIYYHNNADAHDVGKTAIGIADGAAVKSSFPATVKKGERGTVTATVFASDTNPLEVWDGAYMNATEDVYLRYVPGTATIHNGGALNGQSIGPDYLFGEGSLLGYNQFSGLLPGCNEYAGYITYQLFVDAPDFNVEKTIISDSSNVESGDEITYKVRYDNIGTMDQLDVTVKDSLPSSLSYIPGSTVLYNNNNPDGKSVGDDIVGDGLNIGNYAGGSGWAEVVYKVKVNDDVPCDKDITNSVLVSTADGSKVAKTTVKSGSEKCKPSESDPNDPEKELPDEIVNTGPVEIILAVVILSSIGFGGFYFYYTERTLKTVENEVSGKDNKTPDPSQK